MRIALVNFISFYGGGEKRVLVSAREFLRRGHPTTVVGRPDGELARRCPGASIPFAPLSPGRYWSPAAARSLATVLREVSADVAVCYDERAVRLGALAARAAGGPPVAYYYGLEGSFKDKPYNRLVVAPRIACVIANAAAIGGELVTAGLVPGERMRVIYDGVDPTPVLEADPTGAREELGAGPEDVVAITAARLVADKAHALLLDALADVAVREPRLKVWIAGEGPEEPALRARIAELGLEGRAFLLGFRPDVPRLLRAADLLCHPSRREGAPNAVREAMVAGLPVAATAASGTPELVVEGETGLLSPVDDRAALARNLERLAADAGLRARMGAAGRERALTLFSEDHCAEEWLKALGEVLSGRAGQGSMAR